MAVDYILSIDFPASEDERIESILFLSASTGSVIVADGERKTVEAYFDSPEDREEVAAQLRAESSVVLSERDVERRDWLALYQQSLEPLEIGNRFVVAPDRSLISSESGRIAIVVPQERAFGTGSHETTSLCLEALEGLEVSGKRCVDIGTGSAILAIAMEKLGAQSVVAFDNDPEAFDAIRDNLVRNAAASGAIRAFIGSVEALRGCAFEVATMNIIPEVIVPLLPLVRRILAPGATILFSGILVRDRDSFVAAAESQTLRLSSERSKGEWWCGLFRA